MFSCIMLGFRHIDYETQIGGGKSSNSPAYCRDEFSFKLGWPRVCSFCNRNSIYNSLVMFCPVLNDSDIE